MKKLVWFSFIVFLFLCSIVFPQQTYISDVFPLRIDSCWIYYFNTHNGYPAIYTQDEGYINYRIDSNEVYSDSIEWHFSAKRDFIRTTFTHTSTVVEEHHDTLYFTMVEELVGNHQLYTKVNNYLSAFPFFNSAPDSEQFFRYLETDTSGQKIIQLIPVNDYSPFTVTYTLKKDKGILKTVGYMFNSGGWSVNNLFLLVDQVTGIDIVESEFINFNLSQNYPNPFNPSTKISWQSPVSGWQTLKVYDVLGNEVATLLNEYRPTGEYEIEFNPSTIKHHPSSGVYFYRLQIGDPSTSSGQSFVETKKMILLK